MKWYIKLFRFLFIHQRRFECCANCKNVSYGFRCDKVFGDWYGYESGVRSRFWCKNYKLKFKTLDAYISHKREITLLGLNDTYTIGSGGDYVSVAAWLADMEELKEVKTWCG